jgi:hypothetical protein
MAFQYSCFISYRRLAGDMEIVRTLYDAISDEVRRLVPLAVYRDEEGLSGGDVPDERIARALCKSICMIVFYVPVYFDETNTYCAREYRAMMRLEAQRLELLRQDFGNEVGGHGLIIPIIFRGSKFLPPEFLQHRKPYMFEDFTISTRDIRKHPRFREEVHKIADYIYERCLEVGQLAGVGDDCDRFELPSDSDNIRDWVRAMRFGALRKAARQLSPFPFREIGR